MPHGGGGVMVWAAISYGQQTHFHFIDGNLNAQKYRDQYLRPIFSKVSVTNICVICIPSHVKSID
jgi:hypothetical protein